VNINDLTKPDVIANDMKKRWVETREPKIRDFKTRDASLGRFNDFPSRPSPRLQRHLRIFF
jgi:hypothetical protein